MAYVKNKRKQIEKNLPLEVGQIVYTLRPFHDKEGILEKHSRVKILEIKDNNCNVLEKRSKKAFTISKKYLYLYNWRTIYCLGTFCGSIILGSLLLCLILLGKHFFGFIIILHGVGLGILIHELVLEFTKVLDNESDNRGILNRKQGDI